MKKKILLLSDDLRMTSGISTMSKEIVLGTLDRYDWVQLGAAIKHPELGKIVDLSEEVREKTGIKDANLKIIPNNGYGDLFLMRELLSIEKPDAILHFTDPHYWQWLYNIEYEVRQQVPLLFYHVWDNLPDPLYNRNYYESCDWIGCISKQTYGIVKRIGKISNKVTYKPLEDWQVSYVPHGINQTIFKPLDNISSDLKKHLFGDKEYNFVLFYNNRNIRRKQPADVIYSYKLFCDMLPKSESDKCLLLMHTAPVDENGTDLISVINAICPYDVKFTKEKYEQEILNQIYNIVDCTINIANNEGFGLTTAESIMSGTPIIVNITGGLQDQCGFDFENEDYVKIGSLHNKKNWGNLTHGEWVIPVWSISHTINGSPATPYIFDDRVNNDDVAEAIMKMYKIGRNKRKENGLKGREWSLGKFSSKIMCDKISEGIETTLRNYKPRKKYQLYKVI